MTDRELIATLQRMAPETGSLCCLGCGYEHNCSLHGCAIIREAVESLRTQQVPVKLDRSRWGCEWCGFYKSQQQLYSRRIMYCEKCGKPLTEEAWAELERRFGGNDEKTDIL